MIVGDPVRLLPRLRPKDPRCLPLYDGVVQSIDGDRAWVRWSDGARSSVRTQFLSVLGFHRSIVDILTRSADLHDADRAKARS